MAQTILAGPDQLAKNPAAFFENNARLFAEMQRRNPNFGKATRPAVIDPMRAVHELDLYATHQGGFDYYFAHESRPEHWQAARDGLSRLRVPELLGAFRKAEEAFQRNERAREADYARSGDAAFGRNEGAYLEEMAALDAVWVRNVPSLHAALAGWRKADNA